MSPRRKGRRVVVGYDGSDGARRAVEHAAEWAGSTGTVYVVYAYGPPPDWLGSPYYARVLDDHRGHGRAMLDELALDDDALLETNFELELLDGPPADALKRVAKTRRADLIVVGSRGLGRVRGALGSVSQQLLHEADRPVLVIPAGRPRTARTT